MDNFVPWNSQSLDDWAKRYAEGRFIDLAGRRPHFIERGQGRPVLLIRGLHLDYHTGIINLDAVAAHFKVYAPDLWGQGYSTRGSLEYGYDLFEGQIRLIMDAFDIESVTRSALHGWRNLNRFCDQESQSCGEACVGQLNRDTHPIAVSVEGFLGSKE